MSSFFDKAKQKAQEAAAAAQSYAQQKASGTSSAAAQSDSAAEGGSKPLATVYTSSLPHLLRHGIASVDPRHQTNRSYFLYNNALKAVSIDHDAIARETHSLARATYAYGQDHVASSRLDGVGDDALVDISDRMAYILSLTADLHAAHVKRLEANRKTLKSTMLTAPLESPELLKHREKRLAVAKELRNMVPESAKAPHLQSGRFKELQEDLRKLEDEAKAKEEVAARAKRIALQKGWDGYFDSLIELGEKLALAARYGKLLSSQMPSGNDDPVRYPADRTPRDATKEPTWSGALRTAEIRAAVGPALHRHQVDTTTLPVVPAATGTATPGAQSSASSLGRSDTVSYGVSHADDLKANANVQQPAAPELAAADSSLLSAGNHPPSSPHVFGTSPSSFGGHQHATGPLSARLNMNPSEIPVSPTITHRPSMEGRRSVSGSGSTPPPSAGYAQHYHAPPMPGAASHSSSSGQSPYGSPVIHPSHLGPASYGQHPSTIPEAQIPPADLHVGAGKQSESHLVAPDEPTIAETGSPIVGPGGPKTGYLPRRPSQLTGGRPSVSAASSSAAQSGSAPPPANFYETTAEARARKEAEAERERQAAAAAQAEQESLPPYSEAGPR